MRRDEGPLTTPFLCVFLAYVLCYVPKLGSSVAMARQPGGFDNRHPRAQQAQLRGWGARAHAAHLNGFEGAAPFAAGVIIAHLAGLDPHRASVLAITFVVARAAYVLAYVADLSYLRSTLWGLGVLVTSGFYLLPWIG
jgi:uncharacterized MAPEG superfamily protein